ncbi:hypothetical protein IAQ67_28555 (plasmid) [Paenibacillus peoriae]|uniref:Uncharacterized protein n=1 Tax=Paenibacillus peoriae TaxID=59893 RepID=A0A7H0YHA6_9BACL|nr:hypothetical protein [Paenibacillus peoriae]QNR70464.1 hypothetical protein IAQ67_28555 [Paenibacillus peoriae]
MERQFRIKYTIDGKEKHTDVPNKAETVFDALHDLRQSGVENIEIGIVPYLSREHYNLLLNLTNAMSYVSDAIDQDETGALSEALAEMNLFTGSLDELCNGAFHYMRQLKKLISVE